jgi:hypothetical protein
VRRRLQISLERVDVVHFDDQREREVLRHLLLVAGQARASRGARN